MIPGHSQKLTLHCATGPFGPRNMPLFCNQPCAEGNAYWNPHWGILHYCLVMEALRAIGYG